MTDSHTQQRIRRLQRAIGDGPHAKGFNRRQHLERILRAIGDDAALELLRRKAA